VVEGGALPAFNEASENAIEGFALSVTNVLANVRSARASAPGSHFAIEANRTIRRRPRIGH
jgi:hypothetical protein